MKQYDLLEYFLKWFIPFACAGLFAVCVKPLIDAIKRGKRSARDEEFKHAFQHEIAPVQEQLQTIANKSEKEDSRLEGKIDGLSKEIQQATAGLREAILVTHLRDLVADSKRYINQGWLSADEWEDYDNRYNVYRMLGGNGHMDAWYPKVKNLPQHPVI